MNLDRYTNEELIRYYRTSNNDDIRRLCDRLEGKSDEESDHINDLKAEAQSWEREADEANATIEEIAAVVSGDESDAEKLKEIAKILP